MIEFKEVTKTYPDGTTALKGLTFSVGEGELLTVVGPSGCGKTTTMKMINRLISPTEGSIFIHNKDIKEFNIHELRWNIGYVLQQIALFPHMTIEENIAIVPEMKKWKKGDISSRIDELMEMVGLDPATYRKRKPDELSGGEQQRVGVIRALAADPDIILMDEPFSALDPISREKLQQDIRELQQKIQKTIVFVTHDMDEALALGDRVCLMKEGEIVQLDTPQNMILHPKNEFVKEFIGNRKSPWQTAVDVIADQTGSRVISQNELENRKFEANKTYIIQDDAGKYAGAVKYGEKVELPVLTNDMPLKKAADIFEEHEEELLPVVKGQQLIGTLSYRDIVLHLKEKVSTENGVVRS
ncbi:osmoprotectant transport system ATP-binding protein [Thalassobacillus cyri]|uniref:Carnitine transport ATP-binding protein OpuCA n=1 Tax=Thalassobacillus cyri TaxID=571932 RepID=A0A1H4GWP6_9BACI|nr:ABC transporter ATP-binding protein [Thalassobacillus cyri]SEB13995.1 osmoprotectant transport system ATP-binding protein [Thalassobacillus cyri]